MTDFWHQLRATKRDTVFVSEVEGAISLADAFGLNTVHLGADASNMADLQNKWSELTYRSEHAWVLTQHQQLHDAVMSLNMRSQVNTNTGASRSRRWVEHTLLNLPLLLSSPPAASVRLPRVPAFIVGPGPSLEKNGHLLEAARAKGIVIAVNAASKACRPHAVLTLESNDLSHKLEPGDAVRVYAMGAPPHVIRAGTGPLLPFWAGEPGRWVEELTGVERVVCSASGSTAAFMLAVMWGCSPIVLVGHDMAYTGGNMYAAAAGQGESRILDDGTAQWSSIALAAPRPNNPLPEKLHVNQAPGWNGGDPVLSGLDFDNMAGFFEQQARLLAGGMCINATEGGRHLDGWRDQELETLLHSLPIVPTEGLLERSMGSPVLDVDRMRSFLRYEAVELLLEGWAMPDVVAENRRWRAHPRFGWLPLEAWACWRRMRRLDRIERKARRELGRMCREMT